MWASRNASLLTAALAALVAAGARAEQRPPLPAIESVSGPACVAPGAQLRVRGVNLGTAESGWSLELAGVPLEIAQWTATEIRAAVPASIRERAGAEPSAALLLRSRSGALLFRAPDALELCSLAEPSRAQAPPADGAQEQRPRRGGLAPARSLPPDAPLRRQLSGAAFLGEVLVAAPDSGTAAAVERSAAALGLREPAHRRELASLGFTLVRLRFADDAAAANARTVLRELHPQLRIVPNQVFTPDGDGAALAQPPRSQPLEGTRLARQEIGWPQQPDCGRELRVGIVDTGFDTAHSELAAARIVVQSAAPGQAAGVSTALARHGTAVASLLIGQSVGLLPQAELFAAPAFWEQGGRIVSSTEEIVTGLDWLLEQRVAVINLSLTGPPDDLVEESLRRAQQRGVAAVAAAGNEGPDLPVAFPASLESVVAVTAVDVRQRHYARAARGAEIDLAAPGVDLLVAGLDRDVPFALASGTSFAVPFVSAALALHPQGLRGLEKQARDLGSPGKDPVYGWGLLQASGLCLGKPTAHAPLGEGSLESLAAPGDAK